MIVRIAWSNEVETRMASPAGASCVPYLRREVLAGVAKLWHCREGADEAFIITRLDENPRELVICYAEGRGLHRFAPVFIRAAREQGIPVRAHTTSPFIVRLVRRFGLYQSEYVLRSAA